MDSKPRTEVVVLRPSGLTCFMSRKYIFCGMKRMISGSEARGLGQAETTRPRALLIEMAFLAVLFILPCGCKRGRDIPALERGKNFNLLLITVDALRIDRLGAYGSSKAYTPNLDRLAEQGWTFKNCYTAVPMSLPSHGTIFTGREPLAHGVRNNGTDVLPERESTWAEVMKNDGFETYALVSSYLLHSKFGLTKGFDTYDDSLDDNTVIHNLRTTIAADQVFARFQSWLSQRSSQRFFAWVHFSDPQALSKLPPEYAKSYENDPYGGKVALVDHYIGEMVRALEGKNLQGRTVIVIAGSHGEALHEHGEWGHGLFCYETTLKVPLIIYNPAAVVKNRVMASRVGLLDLMPSLLQLFNLKSPAGVQGTSFLKELTTNNPDRPIDRPIYFESLFGFKEMGFAPLTGLIRENYKYISLPEAELYDLNTDPAETENLARVKRDVAQSMDAALRLAIENQKEKHGDGPEKAERNRPTRSSRTSRTESPAIDPKKGIDAVERLLDVERLIDSNKWSEADKALQGIRLDYQGWTLPQVFDYQFLIDKNNHNPKKAEETLRQAADKFPELDRFKLSLAQVFTAAGRLGDAEKICIEALAGNPGLSQAHILLATVYQKSGRAAQAISSLEKAVRQEPHNARLQLEYAARLAELGKREKALDILKNLMERRALTAEPAAADIQADIGGLLMKIGELEMAHTLLLDLVAQGRGNSLVWTQIGLGYFDKGNPGKARESLEKALSLDPQNGLALSGMGTFHLSLFRQQKQKADLDKAIAYYAQAKEASPELATAVNGLGVAYRYAGDQARAIACWKQALALDPGFTDTYFNLGITLFETGRMQEALAYLNTCKEKYSDRLSEKERQQLDRLISEIK
jgi:arylsulfatase A-like enzyme/Tfp pilus assembly protein PilF